MYSPGRGYGFFSGGAVACERVALLVGIALEDASQLDLVTHAEHVQDRDGVVDVTVVLLSESGVERRDDEAVEPSHLDADGGQVALSCHVTAAGDLVDRRGDPCHLAQVVRAILRLLVEESLNGQAGCGG